MKKTFSKHKDMRKVTFLKDFKKGSFDKKKGDYIFIHKNLAEKHFSKDEAKIQEVDFEQIHEDAKKAQKVKED